MPHQVQAAGALLKYLEKMRIGIELEDSDVRVPVLAVHMFSLYGTLLKHLFITPVKDSKMIKINIPAR